jgi:hypothetical protein
LGTNVGIFIKALPGFAVFHPANDCVPVANLNDYGVRPKDQCSEKRMKNLAMDLGGVAELYLPHCTGKNDLSFRRNLGLHS